MPEQPNVRTDIDDLLGDEPPPSVLPVPPVDVAVRGPVRSQELPSVAGIARTFGLTATQTQQIVGHDPARRRLTLISTTDDFYVGTRQGDVDQGVAALWPAGVALAIEHCDAVYARATATTTISALVENWAG